MERALLVTVKLDSEKKDSWDFEEEAKELAELTSSSSGTVAKQIICPRHRLTPALYIGKGKAEEIAELCHKEGINTVIFNHDLSGTQQRNLEEIIGVKTLDRTQLILDIFARHAKSPEGKMQVELAQLEYLLPRLTGRGIMLSRLGGGIGTRGPGEQKLEVDRRRIRHRIDKLKDDLKHLFTHRQMIRKKRKERALPLISLVGYTNAGKSTLLNALTGAKQPIDDSLFTTLDSLSRLLILPNHQKVILSDTVGFLSRLPLHLIEAFKATLEEVKQADLLIHVLDISHSQFYQRSEAVYKILKELRCEDKPIITALNKIDLLKERDWLARLKNDFPEAVHISAKFKENFAQLLNKIICAFAAKITYLKAFIPMDKMSSLDYLYRKGEVKSKVYTHKGIIVEVDLPFVTCQKLINSGNIKRIN